MSDAEIIAQVVMLKSVSPSLKENSALGYVTLSYNIFFR